MKIEVHLQGGLRKIIDITPGATIGATIGKDVFNADGTLFVPTQSGGTSQLSITSWELILNIPANVTALANTATTGLYAITATGASATREIEPVAGETTVSNGSGVSGNPQVGLADVTPAAGGTLQKYGFDAKGRRNLQDAATTDNLNEGTTNLYFTDARARAAVIASSIVNGDTTHSPSGDAVFDALALKADDSAVVHKAGAETITGAKTFSADQYLSGVGTALRTDANTGSYLTLRDGVVGVTLSSNGGVRFMVSGGTEAFRFQSGAAVFNFAGVPVTDNGVSWGAPASRWSEIFAANGTINTSDEREKSNIRELTPQELACSSDLAQLPRIYQWNDSLAEKGESARLHCSPTVQSVISCMESHGLDPFLYGFVCYDKWDEQLELWNEWPDRAVVIDKDGNIVQEAVEAGRELVQEYRPAGDRYSLRPSELQFFIARGQEERIRRLEALLNQ